jgi:hypothetical protein
VPGGLSSSPHTTASKVELAAFQIQLDQLVASATSVHHVQAAIKAHDEVLALNGGARRSSFIVAASRPSLAPAPPLPPTTASPARARDADSLSETPSHSPDHPRSEAPSVSASPPPQSLSLNANVDAIAATTAANDDDDDDDTEEADPSRLPPAIPPTPPSGSESMSPAPVRRKAAPPREPPPVPPPPPPSQTRETDVSGLRLSLLPAVSVARSDEKPPRPSVPSPQSSPKGGEPKSPLSSSPARAKASRKGKDSAPSTPKAAPSTPKGAPSTPKTPKSSDKKSLSQSARKERDSGKKKAKKSSLSKRDRLSVSAKLPSTAAAAAATAKVLVNLGDSDDSENALLRALEAEAAEKSDESSNASDGDSKVSATSVLAELFDLLRGQEIDRMLQLAENWHSALDLNRRDANGRTLLCLAASIGNATVVQRLLALGAKPTATTSLGSSPLHCAARHGRADICSLLLELDVEASAANKHGVTPLHAALSTNQHHVVPLLVDAGASAVARDSNGCTPLHVGCALGHAAAVRALLHAVEHSKPDGQAQLAALTASKDDSDLTPLLCAVLQDHARVVEQLVRYGATNDADADGLTPLSVATHEPTKQILTRAFVAPAAPEDDLTSSESGSLTARRRHAEEARRRKTASPTTQAPTPPAAAAAASSSSSSSSSAPAGAGAGSGSAAPSSHAPAAPIEAGENEAVAFEGPLMVREGALRKQWVERYATLQNGELSCYADKAASKTSDALWFITVDDHVEQVPLKDAKAAFAELTFELVAHSKHILFRARTPEDKLAWVNKINLLKYSREHGGTAGLHLRTVDYANVQQRSISSDRSSAFRTPVATGSPVQAITTVPRRPIAVPALNLSGGHKPSSVLSPTATAAVNAAAAAANEDETDESESDNLRVPTVNLSSKTDRRKSMRRLHNAGAHAGDGQKDELSPRFKVPHLPSRKAAAARKAASGHRSSDEDSEE